MSTQILPTNDELDASGLATMLQNAQDSQCEREMLRQELEAYVKDISERTDDNGDAFVTIPENFAEIVDSMTRNDLTSTDEDSWARCLLTEQADSQLDKNFSGRYSSMLADGADTKIKRGLARIYMLDRQLKDLTIRSALNSARSTTADAEGFDATFLTRKNVRKTSSSSSRVTTASNSAVTSPRAGVAADRDAETQAAKKFDPLSKSLLSAEEEARVAALLDGDADVDSESAFNEYLTHDAVLNERLEQYGHTDRLLSPSSSIVPLNDSFDAPSSGQKPNYLAAQREERLEREHQQRVEAMLQRITARPVEMSGLLGDEVVRVDSAKMSGRQAHEPPHKLIPALTDASTVSADVTPLSEVNPDRVVTRGDIEALVQVLSARMTGSDSRFIQHTGDLQDVASTENFEIEPSPGITRAEPMASQFKIRQLLTLLSPDVATLAELKAQQRKKSCPVHVVPSKSRFESTSIDADDHTEEEELKQWDDQLWASRVAQTDVGNSTHDETSATEDLGVAKDEDDNKSYVRLPSISKSATSASDDFLPRTGPNLNNTGSLASDLKLPPIPNLYSADESMSADGLAPVHPPARGVSREFDQALNFKESAIDECVQITVPPAQFELKIKPSPGKGRRHTAQSKSTEHRPTSY